MEFYSKLLVIIRNNKTKVKKAFGIVTVGVGLRCGKINSIPASLWSNSPQQMERGYDIFEKNSQNDFSQKSSGTVVRTGSGILIGNQQISEGSESALIIRSGDLGKSGPGPRAKADARKAAANRAGNSKAGNSQSGGSPFTEAFTVEPEFPARPGQNRDGLFGRFSARPTPDPHNPGCAGVPRSITVLSGQRNSDSSTKLTAYDGFEAKLTDKSENHLTSKHGHKFGVDDPLPRNPNQKPTKYEQTRTRLNNENKAKVREEIKSILSNTNSDIYPDVSIRGIQGRVYHCKDTNRVVGIHTEGEFADQIMKAQPISDPQLELLRELNILD